MSANTATDTSPTDLRYKLEVERYLAETLKIVKNLQTERKRHARTPERESNIVDEVKAILEGKS